MKRAEVSSLQKVSDSWYLLKLRPETAAEMKPGQFVFLRLSDTTDPLLRRPFSIHFYDPEDNTVWLLFQVAGRGTLLMTGLSGGDSIDYLGPLGNGFQINEEDRKAILVSGGIGLAPLFFLAFFLKIKGVSFDLLTGTATAGNFPAPEYFKITGTEPIIATDDGTAGYRGSVTDLLEVYFSEEVKRQEADRLYACGPLPMLSSVVTKGRRFKIPVQVSLEARMACGVGACLGCICKTKVEGEYGGSDYRRVCREGPVFHGEVVDFDTQGE